MRIIFAIVSSVYTLLFSFQCGILCDLLWIIKLKVIVCEYMYLSFHVNPGSCYHNSNSRNRLVVVCAGNGPPKN